MNLRWSWDAPDPGPVPLGRPRRVGRHRARPGAAARPGRPRAARRPGRRRRASCASSARSARSSSATSTATAGSRPATARRCARSPTSRPSSASPRPCRSTPAASACSPATTSRRPATSACRWSASASSTATATSASRCRSTAGSRSATPTSTRTRMAARAVRRRARGGRPRRRARSWPGSGRPRSAGSRCTCSTPTSTRTRPTSAAITDRLYGGDTEHRLRQEILLGIGGVRALDALGIDAQVFHTNEGHAGFLGLERIRQLVKDPGLSLPRGHRGGAGRLPVHHPHAGARPASTASRASSSSSTSPGGPAEVGITLDELMALGHRPGDAPDERFNMAVMGLRLAGRSNGVAKLHGEVSREMFGDLWPDVPTDEVPITSITNGVHAHTWVAPEMADLLTRHVLPEWHEADGRAVGAPRRGPRRRALAGPRAGPRGPGRLRAVPRLRTQLMAPRAVGVRRRVDRLGARPQGAHDRLRPPLRHLQAGHAPAVAARPPAGAAALRRPAGAARVRRQVAPGRRLRQGADPPDHRVRRRPRRPPPVRVRRGLRHRRGPQPCCRAPTCGSTTPAARRRPAARRA